MYLRSWADFTCWATGSNCRKPSPIPRKTLSIIYIPCIAPIYRLCLNFTKPSGFENCAPATPLHSMLDFVSVSNCRWSLPYVMSRFGSCIRRTFGLVEPSRPGVRTQGPIGIDIPMLMCHQRAGPGHCRPKFARRCIPYGCVAEYPDMPSFSFPAGRAPQRPRWRPHFFREPLSGCGIFRFSPQPQDQSTAPHGGLAPSKPGILFA